MAAEVASFGQPGTPRYRFEQKEAGEYSISRDRQDRRTDGIVVGQAIQSINSYCIPGVRRNRTKHGRGSDREGRHMRTILRRR